MKKYIGTTLIFTLVEDNVYKAIQSSFILELNTIIDFKEQLKDLVNNLIQSDSFKDYSYLGVSDLYITESEGKTKYLGRSSLYDIKTQEEAKKYILNEKKIKKAFENTKWFDKSNLGLVYFHQDEEGEEYNSTIIIYSLITKYDNLKYIYEFANSKSFKEKILHFSVEQLSYNRLIFIGISELYPIKEKGLFTQSAIFKSIDEVKSEVFSERELENAFKDVLDDYMYIDNL